MTIALAHATLRHGGLAAAAVLTAAIAAAAPTPASAFDIEGLIGTAIALHLGAYHGAPYRHYGRHVAARRERTDEEDRTSAGIEPDARDVSTTPRAEPSRVAAHRPFYATPSSPRSGIAQASERDAAAGETAVSGRSSDDEPAFHPAR